MSIRWLAMLALVAALGLLTPVTLAGQGKGHGKGNPHVADRYDDDDDRWEHHDRYDLRIYGPQDRRPPGWSKGNKTGWGNCGLPPGQAKKYGCRTYIYSGRRYYYYEEGGRIIIRRPRIDIHVH